MTWFFAFHQSYNCVGYLDNLIDLIDCLLATPQPSSIFVAGKVLNLIVLST